MLCVFLCCVCLNMCLSSYQMSLSFIYPILLLPFYSSIHPSNFNCLLFYHPSLLSIHSTVYHSWTNNQLKLSTILSFIIISNFNCLPFYLVIFIHTCIQMSIVHPSLSTHPYNFNGLLFYLSIFTHPYLHSPILQSICPFVLPSIHQLSGVGGIVQQGGFLSCIWLTQVLFPVVP